MGIAARDKRHTDVELPGEVLLLRLVKSAERSPPAISPIDADRTVDVTIVRAERFTVESYQRIGIEHLRDHGGPVIELTSESA